MSAQPAAAELDVVTARRLTRQLREALTLSLGLLTEVFEGRAWVALGHESWEAYCAAELPELAQLRIPLEERRNAVAALRGRGMSVRAIARPLGLSVGTVHADLKARDVGLATVTSLDGRKRPGKIAEKADLLDTSKNPTGAQRTVDLVAAAGEKGLTVRELCRRTGWHHGQASGQLSRLARRGRVRAVAVFRDGCAAYVVPA